MGFFSNLRSAGTVSAAIAFVDKHLRLQAETGRFHGVPIKAAQEMVLSLWQSVPALASGSERPKPVVLAAAALAHGLREADCSGQRLLGDVFHSALQLLLLVDLKPLVEVGTTTGIDSQLLDLTYAVFDRRGLETHSDVANSLGRVRVETNQQRDRGTREIASEPTPVHFSQEASEVGPTAEIYRCRAALEDLAITDDEDVKYCRQCQRTVHRVRDFAGFSAMVAAKRCMWVEPQDRLPGDTTDLEEVLLGDFEAPPSSAQLDPILLRPVADLEPSAHLANALEEARIHRIGDLVQRTENDLIGLNVGHEVLAEIRVALSSRGLCLGTRLDDWPPAAAVAQ